MGRDIYDRYDFSEDLDDHSLEDLKAEHARAMDLIEADRSRLPDIAPHLARLNAYIRAKKPSFYERHGLTAELSDLTLQELREEKKRTLELYEPNHKDELDLGGHIARLNAYIRSKEPKRRLGR